MRQPVEHTNLDLMSNICNIELVECYKENI